MAVLRQDVDRLVEVAAARDGPAGVRAAGRLMTLLEGEPHRLPELFRRLPAERWPRPRLLLGITGAPGAGKSTLVDALLTELRERQPDLRIGVIAVDPSSPFTGGAVLGDRVRMMRHATDPSVFIRSLATRGHLGGLALGVKGVVRVMALAGCDVVLIETVGVGQNEVDVARVADRVLVVLAPGGGDAVQLLKAGLLEVADLFVVNKADTDGASGLHRALLQAVGGPVAEGAGPPPPIHLVSAETGSGVPTLVDDLIAGGVAGRSRGRGEVGAGRNGRGGAGRDDELRADVREAVLEAARRRLEAALERDPGALDAVLGGESEVMRVVDRLFDQEGTR